MEIHDNSTSHRRYGPGYQPLQGDEDQRKPSSSLSAERPKVALKRDAKWLPFASHFFLHSVPLAATATAVQLSFRQVYWADDATWDSKWYLLNLSQQATMDFIQFAAKLHEIIIIASLSAIILHFLRKKLVGKNGLPLGIVVGAYQIGSIEYFLSKSFRKPLFSNLFSQQLGTWIFIVFMGTSIIYANLVGPASAVALEPRLDWWSMTDPFNTSSQPTSYILEPFDTVYPMALRNSTQYENCTGWNGRVTGFCPDGGFLQLYEWATAWRYESITYSVTMSNIWGRGQRNISSSARSRQIYDNMESMALSTTILAELLNLIDGFWSLMHSGALGSVAKVQRPKLTTSKATPVFMPLLQAQCNAWDYIAAVSDFRVPTPGLSGLYIPDTPGIEFQTTALTNFSGSASNKYSETGWKVPEYAWNFTHPMDVVNITWIDATDLRSSDGRSVSSSLGVLVTLPYFYELYLKNGTNRTGQGSLLVPCIVDARWAAAEMVYDPNSNNVVGHNLTDLFKFVDEDDENSRGRWGLSDPIFIAPDYASLIDSKNISGDVIDGRTLVGELLQPFVEDRWYNKSIDGIVTAETETIPAFLPGNKTFASKEYIAETCKTVATILSTVLVDGISRHGLRNQNLGTFFSPKPDGQISYVNLLRQAYLEISLINASVLSDPNVAVNFNIERYGWGYGFKSPTATFAIAVLLVHAIIVILYFAYYINFWLSTVGWRSKAWGSIEELLALAINSRSADKLQNTGAGIDLSSTIMLPVRVRERHSKQQHVQAELVVGERVWNIYEDETLLKIGGSYA